MSDGLSMVGGLRMYLSPSYCSSLASGEARCRVFILQIFAELPPRAAVLFCGRPAGAAQGKLLRGGAPKNRAEGNLQDGKKNLEFGLKNWRVSGKESLTKSFDFGTIVEKLESEWKGTLSKVNWLLESIERLIRN